MIRIAFGVIAVFLLSGCMFMQGTVTSYHSLDGSPQSFAMLTPTESTESLQFRTYSDMVAQRLQEHGWRPAPIESADIAVALEYQISDARELVSSVPVYGQVPTGTATTTGSVVAQGNTASINTQTTQNMTTGVVGSRLETNVVYDRTVRIVMYSLSSIGTDGKPQRVYEGTINSTGSYGDIAVVMPAMLKGLLEEFPGKSGKARTVEIPIE